MTAPLVIEAGILGAASVFGVSRLYDMEKHAVTWPDSVAAFALMIGWMVAAAYSLAVSMLSIKGVEVEGAKWVLLAVLSLTFVTQALKRAGLLKTTVFDDDQKCHPQPPVHAVGRVGPHYADNRS